MGEWLRCQRPRRDVLVAQQFLLNVKREQEARAQEVENVAIVNYSLRDWRFWARGTH